MKNLLFATTLSILFAAGPLAADRFAAHWYDGKAELDGYRLKISRYGQERDGHAVMIFVTEPFSKSKLVKVNDHRKNPSDVFNVLKLNLVRDFQTGIYDYNTMVSVFSRVDDLRPVKITFSSAEWCGHVYSELRLRDDHIEGDYFSYFEDESGPIELLRPEGSITEDNLFILLRGLRGHFLAPGESGTFQLLPGVLVSRLAHRDAGYTATTIRRRASKERAVVPAGQFDCIVYQIEVGDSRSGTFHIESEYPHRIVRWSLAPDVAGELTGSARLEYWRLNDNGHESYLEEIGLGRP